MLDPRPRPGHPPARPVPERPRRLLAAICPTTRRRTGDARRRLDDALASLSDLAASIDGEVGDADPLAAIRDVLGVSHHYDEIIISTLPAQISRWLHLDLPHRVEHTFHLPVTHVVGSMSEARQV